MNNPLFDFLGLRTGTNPFGAPDQWTIDASNGSVKIGTTDAEDRQAVADLLVTHPDLKEQLLKNLAAAAVPAPAHSASTPEPDAIPPVSIPTLLSVSILGLLADSAAHKLSVKTIHERTALMQVTPVPR